MSKSSAPTRNPRRQRHTENPSMHGFYRADFCKSGKGRRAISLIFSLLMLISLPSFTAFAAENHYYIDELNLNIDLPDEMVAITRESPETNKYFSLFGLDYEATMSSFESNQIYLQGMYEDSSRVFTVTAVSDENSRSIGNYNALSDDQLIEVEEAFLKEKEYSSCTIQRYNDYIFMDLQFQTETDGQTVRAEQCNTVVDGNNITLTLQPAKGSELTTADYKVMGDILRSIEFSDKNSKAALNIAEKPEFWYCVIIGAVVIAVAVVVIFAVKKKKGGKKSRQNEKKLRNEEIINELAREYSSGAFQPEQEYSPSHNIRQVAASGGSADEADNETAEQIIEQFRNSEDYEKIRSKKSAGEILTEKSPKTPVNLQAESAVPQSEPKISTPLKTKGAPSLKIVTSGEEFLEEAPDYEDDYIADDEYDMADDEYEYGDEPDEYEEDDEYYDEEEQVIASENSFNQGEDYFDEAPDDEVYSRSTVEDEDEYDGRKSKKRAENKEKAGAAVKTAGAVALNGILIFLNGAKAFFIHLGYFITNLTRLIRKKHRANKHKRAEAQRRREQEEALRRKRENQQRKQQKQSEKDSSGLVKVHSRSVGQAPANRKGTGRNR